MKTPHRDSPLQPCNVLQEHSLLTQSLRSRWKGLPLDWIDAAPKACTRNFSLARPALALLDAGLGQAEFVFDRHSEHIDVGAGAMGLFVADRTVRRNTWQCRAARRIVLDLDFEALVQRGLLAGEVAARTLRQETVFHDPELAAVLRSMALEVAAGCPNGALYAESLSLGVALRLARSHGRPSGLERERGKLSPAQLDRVQEHIRRRLAQELSLVELAAVAGFSAPHFARLFRNTVGQSPHRHVLGQRLERARHLAQATSRPLAEIAAECGFASQSHMTAAFAKAFGTTPGCLRRER